MTSFSKAQNLQKFLETPFKEKYEKCYDRWLAPIVYFLGAAGTLLLVLNHGTERYANFWEAILYSNLWMFSLLYGTVISMPWLYTYVTWRLDLKTLGVFKRRSVKAFSFEWPHQGIFDHTDHIEAQDISMHQKLCGLRYLQDLSPSIQALVIFKGYVYHIR